MQDIPTPAAVALGFGIIGSAWVAGSISSLSLIAVPALQKSLLEGVSPQLITAQWTTLYHIGRDAMPKTALASLVSYCCAAYSIFSSSRQRDQQLGTSGVVLPVVAGVLTVAIAPYTFATMMGTNDVLERDGMVDAKTEEKRLGREEVAMLVARWKTLNLVRSLLPLIGAGIGLVALFCA